MKSKIPVVFLLALFLFRGVGAMSQDKSRSPEQVKFSAEDQNVKQPAGIPQDAWSILKKDNNVLEILASQNLQADQLPCAWFAASEIHLDGSDKRDLVMIGKGMLQGANVTTLWVFAQRPQGLKVLLTLPAHDLLIKPTRTNGYRNIQAIMMTAGRSFDGDTPFRWERIPSA